MVYPGLSLNPAFRSSVQFSGVGWYVLSGSSLDISLNGLTLHKARHFIWGSQIFAQIRAMLHDKIAEM